MPPAAAFQPRPDPALRHRALWPLALYLLAATLVGCLLAAAVVTLWRQGSFERSLLRALAIGLSIYGLGLLTWLRPAWRPPLSARQLAWLLALVVPLGAGLGLAVTAGWPPAPVVSAGNTPRHLVALIATLATSGLVAYLMVVRHRLDRSALEKARLRDQAVQAELRFLQAQLEPHMLFNTLANLRALVEVDVAQSQRMIDALIAYYRAALNNTRQGTVCRLEEEFALLQAYLDVMAMRLGPRLTVRLVLPLALRQQRLPAMLLQPLVENAVKHGVEMQVGPVSVTVQAEAEAVAGGLVLSVSDTGAGWSDEAAAASHGYGLAHVRERLAACYGPSASLGVTPLQPRGTCVQLRVPTLA